MAKTSRSGLGRGLSSLLGGYYEESTTVEKKPSRVTVEIDKDEDLVIEAESSIPRQKATTITQPATPKIPERVVKKQSDLRPSVEEKKELDLSEELKGYKQVAFDVPIEKVIPNPDQPRRNFDEADLVELAESIENNGLLQPILVRANGNGTYQIIAGERRWQACKQIGIKTVSIKIEEADDNKALELALIENLQRTDLNPIEEAYAYRQLMERKNMTQDEVAQVLSKGRSTVGNTIRLLELPEEAQKLLFEGKITAGHARAILSVKDSEKRLKLLKNIIDKDLSVRETERLANLFSGKKKTTDASVKKTRPTSYTSVEKELGNMFHRSVKVRSSRGKNKLEIEFKDEQDLNTLFNSIVGSMASTSA